MLPCVLAAMSGCGDKKTSATQSDDDKTTRPVSVIISGDTAGWIVPCGCTSNQSGGLLRRAGVVAAAKESAETIVLDAGGAVAGTSAYQRAKFEAILRGELLMGLAAHNLGGPELKLGAEYLRSVAEKTEVPFVSANTRDASGKPLTKPHRFVEAGGQSFLVVGVVSPKFATKEIRVNDPQTAVLDIIDSVTDRHDGLIVLAYLPEGELRELAAKLPEADLVVGGPTGQALAPESFGPTQLAAATNKGKFVVRFDRETPEANWIGQVVEITEKFHATDAQKSNLNTFHALLKQRDFSAAETGFAPPQPAGAAADFRVAGGDACRQCHTEDCQSWDETGHAHAWATLESDGSHVDPYCQQCHTESYGLPGGFASLKSSPHRVAVGCETCHGPSLAHVERQARTPFVAKDQCVRCHDQENSPKFEYAGYWSQIAHGENKPANQDTETPP